MKKRSIIIFILLCSILIIQILFYSETLERMKPKTFVRTGYRFTYILENEIKPNIIKENQERFNKTERRIELITKQFEKIAKRNEAQQIAELEKKQEQHNTIIYSSGGHLTPSAGVYYYGNQRETYYNLDMSWVVSYAKYNGIPGEYWVRSDGCKMLGDYIILACNRDVHPYGSIVETSLGLGISLDTGGFAYDYPYGVDIAVNW